MLTSIVSPAFTSNGISSLSISFPAGIMKVFEEPLVMGIGLYSALSFFAQNAFETVTSSVPVIFENRKRSFDPLKHILTGYRKVRSLEYVISVRFVIEVAVPQQETHFENSEFFAFIIRPLPKI
jgi:hypothetical protein